MATTTTELAGEAARLFERAERPDGESYTRLKDGAPEWLSDLVYEAHGRGEMLPDDYRYAWAQEALEAISDAGEDADLDDLAFEFADGMDVYTGELTAWLDSHATRQGYCDDAIAEGLVEPEAGMFKRLQIGQYEERREVFEAVRRCVEAHAEQAEEVAASGDDR